MSTFSNTQSVAQLANQGVFFGIAHNPNTGKYFLVQIDANGRQVGSGSAGSISGPCMEELLAIPANKRNGIPSHYLISDIEVEDEDTGEIRNLKMLHREAKLQPLLFGAPTVAQKPVQKTVAKKIGAF
jgi:hypothetical protein